MTDDIQPTDWFAGLDFATDVYDGRKGTVRATRTAGAAPEADLLDRETVPTDDATYRQRLIEVFGARDDEVARRLAAHPDFRSLSWDARGLKPGAERLFAIASEIMGDVFGFTPAPLAWSPGYPADNAIGLFLNGPGWEKVVLSIRLLQCPFRMYLETVLHEQTHRLQHALTCQLNTPLRPLPPLERGLVLYWLRHEPERKKGYAAAARERDPRRRLALYRSLPVEHHAYSASERIAGSLL